MGVLENPFLWNISRVGFDVLFGLYRKRIRLIKETGCLDSARSVLDIGCGTGQFCSVTEGNYLGIDFNKEYIDYANKKYGNKNKRFLCVDVRRLWDEKRHFDVVLVIDVLHHLGTEEAVNFLKQVSKVTDKTLISIEPLLPDKPTLLDSMFIHLDRGKYIRKSYEEIFTKSNFSIVKAQPVRCGLLLNGRMAICTPKKLRSP